MPDAIRMRLCGWMFRMSSCVTESRPPYLRMHAVQAVQRAAAGDREVLSRRASANLATRGVRDDLEL